MPVSASRPHPRRALQAGFTLLETIMALALLTIGIVGVGAALSLQAGGVARGVNVGLSAVSRGNYITTATMLAQERIEQMRNATYSISAAGVVVDQLTTGSFPTEAYGGITSYTNYRRTVTIQNSTPAANMKTVTVQVFFRPPVETGLVTEESVQMVTIIAARRTT